RAGENKRPGKGEYSVQSQIYVGSPKHYTGDWRGSQEVKREPAIRMWLLQPFRLCRIPQRIKFSQRVIVQLFAIRPHLLLDITEAAVEFGVSFAQGGFRLHLQPARPVDQHEQ